MDSFGDIPMTVAHRAGEAMPITYRRDSAEYSVTLTPKTARETDRFGNVTERGLIGIAPTDPVVEDVSLLRAPAVAIEQTGQIVRQMAEVVGQFITGRRSIKDMGGPLKIADTSGEFAALGLASFIFFVALISINLGFINLLPLPMLDGGHLLFYAYEAVRRRPAPPQVQEWAFRFGFVAIVTLMIVVTFNDLGAFGVWERIARLIG
jgi:regulator of sigma E protease